MKNTYHAILPHLVCVFLFLYSIPSSAITFDDILLFTCSPENYTNPTFENNLNTVLNSLVNHTSSSSNGFNSSVYGVTPERVYGLLQCRGDTTEEERFNCSKLTRTAIRQDCGNVIGARVWLPKCFIRYDNYSFIGTLDTNTITTYNAGQIAVEPDEFSREVRKLFTKLSDEALRSLRRYSAGSVITSTSQPIYSLVQCWSGLTSLEDCKTCLRKAIVKVLNVTGNGTHLGGEAALGSCVARYETYSFFNSVSAPLQSPFPSLSPPAKSKKFSNKVSIVLGIFGGFLLILLLCLFAIRRRFKAAALRKDYQLLKLEISGCQD